MESIVMKVMIKLWHIIKGTFYNIIGKNKQLSSTRMKICNQCECRLNTKLGDFCGECGCLLTSKTKVREEKCPNDKW